jgi:hypothetical protein
MDIKIKMKKCAPKKKEEERFKNGQQQGQTAIFR